MSGPARLDASHRADVVVVGDGPAGSALAAACAGRGIDVLLVGDDVPWRATYGVWLDELDGVEGLGEVDTVAGDVGPITAFGDERHELGRRYAVVDNDALRSRLRAGVERVGGRAATIRTGVTHHSVVLSDGGCVRCRMVVRATGWSSDPEAPAEGPAWQTAFGVVLPAPPAGELGRPTFMDFRPPGAGVGTPAGGASPATFGYALPVADGWLVEETVLAARPAIDPALLRARLALRLGRSTEELLTEARRTEVVAIPMGGPLPDQHDPVVRFGAAAGYVHPATGFSVSTSLRAAGRVADAIGEALGAAADFAADPRPVWDAVWPVANRRTRLLHEYGLERLLGLDGPGLRRFFDHFFALPTADWAEYLRVDASPTVVSRTMARLFRSASWPLRWRLAAGNPLRLARLLRP